MRHIRPASVPPPSRADSRRRYRKTFDEARTHGFTPRESRALAELDEATFVVETLFGITPMQS